MQLLTDYAKVVSAYAKVMLAVKLFIPNLITNERLTIQPGSNAPLLISVINLVTGGIVGVIS